MKVGIVLPQAGHQATKSNIIQTAKEAEHEGFDSLWTWERHLWPSKPQTPYPLTPDGSLPTEYQNVFEPLETLTYVAANTTKIAIGTSVIDMLFHNPIILGRRFATLDVLSEGRAIAGLGIGWSNDEYQASNIPFKDRGKRADEYIQILKQIWTNDIVEFKGQFYDIPASKIGPKPIQKPHLPIYMGGFSPRSFARIVRYADGWIGMIVGSLEDFENTINTIRDQARKEANKDADSFKIILLTYPNVIMEKSDSISSNKEQEGQGQRSPMNGSIDEIGSDLKRIKDFGVEHVILGYNFLPIGDDVSNMISITKQLSRFCK
jgi:probable F420-dependent oxidoreductase